MNTSDVIIQWFLALVIISVVLYLAGQLHMHVFSNYARENRRLSREIRNDMREIYASDPKTAAEIDDILTKK